MAAELTGGCLCGAVTYVCSEKPTLSAHCACIDCRKSSGTSHGTHVVVAESAVSVTGDVTGYDHPADSGNIVRRHFCGTCGGPIYSTNNSMPGMMFLRASSLDDLDAITPSMLVYASRAPKWIGVSDGMVRFAEMPEQAPSDIIEQARAT